MTVSVAAVIVAAGRGQRFGGPFPKQYRLLEGRTVLSRTLSVFLSHPRVERVLTVIHPDDGHAYERVRDELGGPERLTAPVSGGATRQESVRLGLEALSASHGLVLVHDAARPFVDHALIDRVIERAAEGAAIPGTPVTDTIKRVDGAERVVETPPRDRLRAIQTPQGFPLADLVAAHRAAQAAGLDGFTDDGALAEWAGLAVTVVPGDPANVKITREEDLVEAARRLRPEPLVTRVATGFDVHAFAEGDHVWIGGVRIPADRGVLAHSDGDVALHALTDALLGALAEGDIGTHFPPSDERWRSASSDRFLAFAAGRVRVRGGRIDHLDVTLLSEAPRIGPHREAIRARIGAIAGVSAGRVGLKATTTEKLGFVGRREGLAAMATATIRLPEADDGP